MTSIMQKHVFVCQSEVMNFKSFYGDMIVSETIYIGCDQQVRNDGVVSQIFF